MKKYSSLLQQKKGGAEAPPLDNLKFLFFLVLNIHLASDALCSIAHFHQVHA
jgi:hypothetical protein